MTSRGYILSACWILMILHWTTDMFPGGIVPLAFCASFLIMELTGMFKREKYNAEAAREESADGLNERQQDFMRKLEEGKLGSYDPDNDELQAKIVTIDEDGNSSIITIKPDGTVETEGNPDPDIVKAAHMLKDSIQDFGPEAIAEELQRQLDKIDKENK